MKFSIYRFDPDKDATPYMRDYDIELEPADRMLLDALERIKTVNGKFHGLFLGMDIINMRSSMSLPSE